MDILLYDPSGKYVTYSGDAAEGTDIARISGRTATRTETIANKVVKFLLTPYGSDALDTTYGSYLPTYTQIAQSAIPRLYIELQDDIARCTAFIKRIEKALDDTVEKLDSLKLLKVEYAPAELRGLLLIKIEIVTTFSNNALVNIPVKTNG